MTIRRVNTESMAPPIGFSHAVVAESGRIVFLAGQTALNADGVIIGDGIVEQFRVALTNLLTALRESGGSPADLAKITIFSVDPGNYRENAKELGGIWRELVGRDYPAMTLVGVPRLWDIEALVEIEGTAVIP